MAFAIGGTANIDLDKTHTDGKPPVAVGTEVQSNEGTTFKLVKFTAAKNKGYTYIIGDDFELTTGVSTSATSAAPLALGVPQVALEAPDSGVTYAYGWVAIKGPMVLFDAYQPAADVEITTTSFTAGLLSTGGKVIDGLKFDEAALGASAFRSAYAHLDLGVRTDA